MIAQSSNARFTTHFTACSRTFCLFLFAQAQILFVCGCAVNPKPPSQIPAFAPGDDKSTSAPKIAGRFADKGVAFTDKGASLGQVSLSVLLFGELPAYAGADTVAVAETGPDMIEIEVSKQGQSVEKHRFSQYTWDRATGGRGIFANWDSSKLGQSYYVVNGFLDIGISESHGGAAGIGIYAGGTDCLLRKAVDGSLIVLQKQSWFAMIVIVPVGGSRCIWYRFPPIADDSQPQPGLVK